MPNFSAIYSVKGLIDTATVSARWWQDSPVFDIFLLLPQNDIYRLAFIWSLVIFAIFLTIGFCTRFSAVFVYLGLLSLQRECVFVLHGGDDFLRIMGLLLIFSSAGSAYSVDFLLKARKQKVSVEQMPLPMVPGWPQRMMQVQISLAYFYAFLCKIIGPQWQQGVAAYYASHLVEFQKFPLLGIADQAPIYQFLTYYTLFVEFAMATLVWIKPLRYWILLAGLLMHAGIDWTMNLPCFEWLFVSSYIVFIEPQDLQRLMKIGKEFLARVFAPHLRSNKQIESSIVSASPAYRPMRETVVFLSLLIGLTCLFTIGTLIGQPIRSRWQKQDYRRDYEARLAKAEYRWQSRLNRCVQLPDDDQSKLNAQEGFGRRIFPGRALPGGCCIFASCLPGAQQTQRAL